MTPLELGLSFAIKTEVQFMGRWKRGGIIIKWYETDHAPRHGHLQQHGHPEVKFNLESWKVIQGSLTPKMKKVLQSLRKEGLL